MIYSLKSIQKLLIIGVLPVLLACSCESKKIETLPIIKEGYIQVPGGKVWYRIVGADKPGIPLLTIHGGPGAPHDYLEPLESLADERPVIFYDQLGCGFSDKPDDTTLWTVPRFTDELQSVRTALNLDRVHLLGTSWGTMLSVEYILRHNPEGIGSLTLSGPYLSTPRWMADQQAWIAQLPQNIQDTIRKYEENGNFASPSYQEAMNYFYMLHLCRMDPWPDCVNRAFEKLGVQVYEYMWGPSEFTMTGTLKHADLTGRLGEISIPTLFTCGEFDEATPGTTGYYQSLVPGAEIYVFSDASHMHQLEKQEEYLQVVRSFLGRSEK